MSQPGPEGRPAVEALRGYAFVGDGRRGGLIDTDGRLAWLCFPDWSDPALFAGLLGSGGDYRVTPRGRRVPGGFYEEGTLIWHSRWVTEEGIVESRDALAYPGERRRAVLLRTVTAVDHHAQLEVTVGPAADYGRTPFSSWRQAGDRWLCDRGPITVRWTGAPDAVPDGRRLRLPLDLQAGESRTLVLELISGNPEDKAPLPASEWWYRTERSWRAAVPGCSGMAARRDVRMALAVLRGMTAEGGATVAAATTSLPERAEAARNYDYRYSWMRDTCYVGHAGAAVPGAEAVLDDAVRWATARLLDDGDRTMPAYRTDGSPVPEERSLELPGYPGGHDVVGNRVRDQFQLDLFGECLLLFGQAAAAGRLEKDGWEAATVAIEAIEKRWHEPEAGVWEIDPRLWTHSRLISMAGLQSVAREAPSDLGRRALRLADGIERETNRTSRHRSGRWKRAPDDERVDAALLLAEIRGALPPGDPRSEATRRAIAHDLVEDGYVYRYRHPGSSLGEAEGAFLICNFWMALAAAGAGDPVGAARWFERGRAASSTSGLFSEEFDVAQRQLRGNIPQAFVHALLVEAATVQPEESTGAPPV